MGKMTDRKRLEILDKSIKKWKDIVYHDAEDLGVNNCACCGLWFHVDCGVALATEKEHSQCPIAEYSGLICCRTTPYKIWDDWFVNYEDKTVCIVGSIKCIVGCIKRIIFNKETRILANRELSFLYEVRRWLVCEIIKNVQ